ncbi:2-amino-4-hydroxy-6-hydroxymethyldihydropteridine diphosphokinase [Sphingomonas sp. PL-96]|uniref:2-amino-4-hydroxy-6- hydroxymethyldihydropteridine diphosphokinase n=1 Tax=Sphingomonas sp. PL-96 TaxID=2887201 RepID=UPI001E4AF355|nr:2-amino-4-hydroxy-6-hydroxymethyldihydropteridine diphosphokinase [Sphingomonas sp. PL-96]MCC2977478.1 2-amino-4-hydroxy-6-hydroxymethyldihydropteridine diphosphokinase [Sphingomonas sp. PL-96]
MARASYAIAIGSNRPGRHGRPEQEVAAALVALGGVVAAAPVMRSAPLGPSLRRYANTVALVESALSPPEMLARCKAIERGFGRRPGRRWGARVLDLDLVLWSEGAWASPGLIIPHPAFRARDFVLEPLSQLVPDWRDPVSGRTIRQLAYGLRRPHVVDRTASAS